MIRTVRQLDRLFGRHRARWLLLLVLVAVTSAMEAVAAALVFALVDLLSSGEVDLPVAGPVTTEEGLGLFATVVTTAFLMRAGLVVLHDTVLYRLCYRAGAELEEQLLRGYLTLPPRDIRRRGHAELVRNVHDTVITVVEESLIPSVLALGNALRTLGIIAVMISVAPVQTALAGVVFLPALWLVSWLARRPVRRLGDEVEATLASSLRSATETLALASDIRLAGRSADYFGARFGSVRTRLARAAGTEEVIAAAPRLAAETLLVLFVVGYVALAFARGAESSVLPTLGLFTYAALRVLPGLISLAALAHSINHSASALETLTADAPLLRAAATPVPSTSGPSTLTLDHVTVRVPGTGRAVLDGVDLDLARGDVVAVIGGNGAGKSTLLDVLAGALAPDEGLVRVDGRPLTELELSWPSSVAMVPQHVHLLDADVPTNVALGLSGASPDDPRLVAVLREVGLEPVIERLRGATVGENGRSLSGGERQRVAIARALYRSAGVLLVDEGTSALDKTARDALVQLVTTRDTDRITVLVTHDPELARACTRVVTVHEGRLRGEGAPADASRATVAGAGA